MATFNSFAVNPIVIAGTPVAPVWAAAADLGIVLGVNPTTIAPVWPAANEVLQPLSFTQATTVAPSAYEPVQYTDGFYYGEVFGSSSQKEDDMYEPIQLGETDDDKKTISFRLYDSTGLPASGASGEGAVLVPIAGQVQTNRDLAGYTNILGTFTHVADGEYRYTFANSEVATGGGEGNIWLRVKATGYRTTVIRIPIRDIATPTSARDAVLNAVRSGFVGTGTIGEGIAIAASLLQGNFFMDQVTNTSNGQTAARIRCFHTGAATAAATAGGSGQGEFATFLVTTTYAAANQIITHRVVQQ